MNHQSALAALPTAAGWHKSRRSGNGQGCVEVTTALKSWVGVRDTKLRDASPIIAVSADAWRSFLAVISR